jgi:8-oxo-dGTP pyrophosphatase MutT (NUDIX family)
MARTQNIAKLLSHIAACHTATLPGARLPFYLGTSHVGYVPPDFAQTLADISTSISLENDHVVLAADAAGRLNDIAIESGILPRGEDFDVKETAESPALTVLDRGALPGFGVIGVGAHLNGLVRRPEGFHLWVGKRAADKKLDPGKLDHLVAGGVPAGLTPLETLIKEAAEEAALPEHLAAQAKQVGRFAYNLERPEGLRRDVIYAYDLILPDSFTPQPADGEVEYFELWPLDRVFEAVATTHNFKFNVNLVLIDLFIRQNMITGADAATLRAALQGPKPA